MRTIYQAKDLVHDNFGKDVTIRVNGLRNKTEIYKGKISECYKSVFILDTDMGKKSFTYTDILIGNIKLIFK